MVKVLTSLQEEGEREGTSSPPARGGLGVEALFFLISHWSELSHVTLLHGRLGNVVSSLSTQHPREPHVFLLKGVNESMLGKHNCLSCREPAWFAMNFSPPCPGLPEESPH